MSNAGLAKSSFSHIVDTYKLETVDIVWLIQILLWHQTHVKQPEEMIYSQISSKSETRKIFVKL